MVIVAIIIGLALLFLGRELFWFFVGAAGFMLGFIYGPQIFRVQTPGMILLIAFMAGIICALLALLLRGVAIALGGFIAGGFVTVELLRSLGIVLGPNQWLAYFLGGIIGAIFLLLVFNWALIVLSSLLGASIIAHSVAVYPPGKLILFLILTVVGVLFQADRLAREKRRKQ
jgi:hypothetical protein